MIDSATIYKDYRIPSWLALHMYRVAAVAMMVFDANGITEGREDLRDACLLHDMGNVIKFNFATPIFPIPNEEYWQQVQKEMIATYGRDEHHATLAILDELHVAPRVRALVDAIGFHNNERTLHSGDLLTMIAAYADSRVIPSGVASLAERMRDMYERYGSKHPETAPETERQVRALQQIEQVLFEHASIRPEDITEASVAPLVAEMSALG